MIPYHRRISIAVQGEINVRFTLLYSQDPKSKPPQAMYHADSNSLRPFAETISILKPFAVSHCSNVLKDILVYSMELGTEIARPNAASFQARVAIATVCLPISYSTMTFLRASKVLQRQQLIRVQWLAAVAAP